MATKKASGAQSGPESCYNEWQKRFSCVGFRILWIVKNVGHFIAYRNRGMGWPALPINIEEFQVFNFSDLIDVWGQKRWFDEYSCNKHNKTLIWSLYFCVRKNALEIWVYCMKLRSNSIFGKSQIEWFLGTPDVSNRSNSWNYMPYCRQAFPRTSIGFKRAN